MRLLALLRRNGPFARLAGAGLISQCGDWILTIGLAYYVYAATGSALASGGLVAASVVPQILLGSVTGVFVDRWDRRRTVVVANVVMAACAASLALVTSERIWQVYPAICAIAVVEAFFVPAEQALVPSLVATEDLVACNALNGQAAQVARLVGAAVGGALAALGGLQLVVGVDVATYLVAAVLLTGLPRPERRAAPPLERAHVDTPAGRVAAVVTEWRDGLRLLGTRPALRLMVLVVAVTSIGEGVFGTLFLPYVRTVLGASPGQYGAIMGLQAAGSIAAGLLLATVAVRLEPWTMLGGGYVAFGALDLVLFLYWHVVPGLWPAFVLIVVVGLPVALFVTGRTTLLQLATEHENRGRVFGALGALAGCGLVVGLLVAGVLADRFAIVPVLVVQGIAPVVVGLTVLSAAPRVRAAVTTP